MSLAQEKHKYRAKQCISDPIRTGLNAGVISLSQTQAEKKHLVIWAFFLEAIYNPLEPKIKTLTLNVILFRLVPRTKLLTFQKIREILFLRE